MNTVAPLLTQAAMEQLRALPFVDEVELRPREERDAGAATAGHAGQHVAIRAGRTWHVFRHEVLARPWDELLADRLRNIAAQHAKHPLLLVARHLKREGRERLHAAGMAYVDAAGNCFVQLGRDHVAWIDGRHRPTGEVPAPARRGLGVAGYQVEFTLLAEPGILNRPVRDIAAAAGVGKTVVADLLERLRAQGLMVERGADRRLVDRPRLLDDWLGGYDRLLRPRLLLGEFEAPDAGDAERLQARLEDALGEEDAWAFGGGIAAKHWTGHWRGELTVLHVARADGDLPRRLRLLPARRGRIQILRAPFRAGIDRQEHLAHPLLVFAELMSEGHERAREAGLEVRQRFPEVFA